MTAMLTDRFLGENLCSAKDKAVWVRKLSLPTKRLLIALDPSFWEDHGMPLLAMVLPNLWQ